MKDVWLRLVVTVMNEDEIKSNSAVNGETEGVKMPEKYDRIKLFKIGNKVRLIYNGYTGTVVGITEITPYYSLAMNKNVVIVELDPSYRNYLQDTQVVISMMIVDPFDLENILKEEVKNER